MIPHLLYNTLSKRSTPLPFPEINPSPAKPLPGQNRDLPFPLPPNTTSSTRRALPGRKNRLPTYADVPFGDNAKTAKHKTHAHAAGKKRSDEFLLLDAPTDPSAVVFTPFLATWCLATRVLAPTA
mmetsp:Transcript_5959/g.22539  ORF Transcript_5959/g.22539 Transcript_5959/m.22539 type:complete len:125 (-) Transcript_5959:1658-2032(-)